MDLRGWIAEQIDGNGLNNSNLEDSERETPSAKASSQQPTGTTLADVGVRPKHA